MWCRCPSFLQASSSNIGSAILTLDELNLSNYREHCISDFSSNLPVTRVPISQIHHVSNMSAACLACFAVAGSCCRPSRHVPINIILVDCVSLIRPNLSLKIRNNKYPITFASFLYTANLRAHKRKLRFSATFSVTPLRP